jgi:DNA-binding NarL/FixJ family response regulator
MTISILLVDDHAIFRKSLRTLLEASTNLQIVGEAADGMNALILAGSLCPEVVILDYAMPEMNGVEVARQLHIQQPEIHVLMLSMHDDEAYVSNAIHNGARGYLLKDDIITHLAEAVTSVAAGQYFFSPKLREIPALSEMVNLAAQKKVAHRKWSNKEP